MICFLLFMTVIKRKKGYTCEFLDLHSIKNIYIYSNIGNYNSIAPNGSIANIDKNVLNKRLCLYIS